MTSLTEQLHRAGDHQSGEDYIDAVKSAFRAEIVSMDEWVEIEDTKYFNHSAIPDFVLTWRSTGETRPFYLRGSYESVSAARDLENLASEDPILVSLNENQFGPISAELHDQREILLHSSTLLTDAEAIGAVSTHRPDKSPLTELVKSNFLSGGRGLVEAEQAAQLASIPSSENAQALDAAIRKNFSSSAATRIQRTADIMNLALGGDLSSLTLNPDEPQGGAIRGVLSSAELKLVLPWLLKSEGVTREATFWAYISEMMTFADLVQIANEIDDTDVTPLIAAASTTWRAKRAYIGRSRIAAYGDVEALQGVWAFRGNVLTFEQGEHSLQLSLDGRKLKGRESSSLPRWEDLKQPLRGFNMLGTSLKGITRSISVSSAETGDVRDDVARITESVDDDYFVEEVELIFNSPGDEPATRASVIFDRAVVVSDTGTSLENLTKSAVEILGFRQSLDGLGFPRQA